MSHQKSTKAETIKFGGETIKLRQLGPREGVELCLLVGPYIPKFKRVWKIWNKEMDPDEAVFRLKQISATIAESAPTDFMELIGILVGRNLEWVASHVTAQEILECWPTLMEFHNLLKVVAMGELLGLLTTKEPD